MVRIYVGFCVAITSLLLVVAAYIAAIKVWEFLVRKYWARKGIEVRHITLGGKRVTFMELHVGPHSVDMGSLGHPEINVPILRKK